MKNGLLFLFALAIMAVVVYVLERKPTPASLSVSVLTGLKTAIPNFGQVDPRFPMTYLAQPGSPFM